MTHINLSHNQFLTHLLTNIATALTTINKDDPALRQAANKLNVLLSNPNRLSGEELLSLITKAKDIVVSYGIKPSGDKPSEDPLANLPGLFYNAVNEIDNMITKEQVMGKVSMDRKITAIWEKLASYRAKQ